MEVTLKNSNNSKKLLAFIGGSLFVHFLVMFAHISGNSNFLLSKPEETVVKIKLQNFKNDAFQITTTEQSKINNAKNAKFLSNKNNAFERETKSANNGTFQAASKGVRDAINKKH